MMDSGLLLMLFSQVMLSILCGLSLVNFLRHADRPHFDILLMVLSLAIPISMEVVVGIFYDTKHTLHTITSISFLLHPYLLLRLTHNAHLIPGQYVWASGIGIGIFLALLIFVEDLFLLPTLVIIIATTTFFEGSAIIALLNGAQKTSGVMYQRLSLAALGTCFVVLFGFTIFIPFIVEIHNETLHLLFSLTALGATISYYFAFAMPRPIRQYVQIHELQAFLTETIRHDKQLTQDYILDSLLRFSQSMMDSQNNLLVEWDTASQQLIPNIGADKKKFSGLQFTYEAFSEAVQKQDGLCIRARTCEDISYKQLLSMCHSEMIYVLPIHSQDIENMLLLVCLENESLFPQDDLEILSSLIHYVNLFLDRNWRRQQAIEDEITRYTIHADLLKNIAIITNELTNQEQAFAAIIEKICHVAGAPVGHIFVRSSHLSEQLPSNTIWYSDNPEHFAPIQEVSISQKDKEIIDKIVGETVSYSSDNLLETTMTVTQTLALKKCGIVSAFTFPIYVQQQVEAIIELYFTEDTEISDDFQEVMQQIGVMLGRIIERKNAEQAVQKNFKAFQATFEQSAVGMAHSNLDGRFLRVNSKLCDMFGYSEEEFLKLSWFDITYPEDKNKGIEIYHQLLAGEIDVYTITKRYSRKDGYIIWCDLTVSMAQLPLEDDQYVMVVLKDITGDKKTQQALEDSEARFASILEMAQDAIIILDDSLNIVQSNLSAGKMFSYTSGELEGQCICEFMPEWVQDTQTRLIRGIANSPMTAYAMGDNRDLYFLTSKGQEFTAEVTISRVELSNQTFITVFLRDATKRKAMQARLVEERNLLRTIIDSVQMSIYMKDIEGRFRVVNPHVLKLLGQTYAQEVIGKTDLDFLPDELANEYFDDEQAIIKTGKPLVDKPETMPTPIGIRQLITTKRPLYDAGGNIIGIVGTEYDVTERQEMLDALHQAEERFAIVFHQSPVPISISYSDDARIVDANDACLALFEYSRDEMIGKTTLELGLWANVDDRSKTISNFDEGQQLYEYDFRAKTRSGNIKYLQAYVSTLELDSGKHFVTIFYDMTQKHEMENVLREREQRFRALMESAPDALVIVNMNGEIVLVNKQAEHLFGYDREELLGKPVEILVPIDYGSSHISHRQRYIEDPHVREMGSSLELYALRKDKTQLPVEISLGPIVTQGETLIAASIRDITDRRQILEHIRQLNQELEQRVIERTARLEAANQELEAFTYSVSHDLRAPLRAINSYYRYMNEYVTELPETAQHYLGRIHANAQRMGDLIDTMLALSRLDRQSLVIRTVVTNDIVDQAIDTVLQGISDPKPCIQVKDLPNCYADSTLLRQVFINLIDNAAKFSSKSDTPQIDIGFYTTDDETTVYFVKDNGAGFDMDFADKLFGVFQRLHDEDEFDGIGAGLSIVHRIIHRHMGRIWAIGEVNNGATFFFTLNEDGRVKD